MCNTPALTARGDHSLDMPLAILAHPKNLPRATLTWTPHSSFHRLKYFSNSLQHAVIFVLCMHILLKFVHWICGIHIFKKVAEYELTEEMEEKKQDLC